MSQTCMGQSHTYIYQTVPGYTCVGLFNVHGKVLHTFTTEAVSYWCIWDSPICIHYPIHVYGTVSVVCTVPYTVDNKKMEYIIVVIMELLQYFVAKL